MSQIDGSVPFDFPLLSPPEFPPLVIHLADFLTQKKLPEKKWIQAAIDHCATLGGGVVHIPEGVWQTGAIHLQSNIHLNLAKGAIVNFSTEPNDYLPVVFTRWEGMECYNYSPLIYANGCENIAITGEGTFEGNGQAWWHWKRLQQEAATELCYAQSNHIPVNQRIYGTEKAALRPSFIQPIHCKNIWIQGVTIKDGPQWMVHPVYCENVRIEAIRVISDGHNTDGLNPDSCKNVLIQNCFFQTGDDCIAINSGMNEDGWRVGRPCENIVIRDCQMTGGHGGIVIGSGMSGGVKNVYASNCQIKNTHQGIRMKAMRGRGGYVENIWVENIEINQVEREAIQVNMFYQYTTVPPKSTKAPRFTNIFLKNIQGSGADIAVEVIGLPERKIGTIQLENIHLNATTGYVCHDIENLTFKQVQVGQKMDSSSEFNQITKSQFQDVQMNQNKEAQQ